MTKTYKPVTFTTAKNVKVGDNAAAGKDPQSPPPAKAYKRVAKINRTSSWVELLDSKGNVIHAGGNASKFWLWALIVDEPEAPATKPAAKTSTKRVEQPETTKTFEPAKLKGDSFKCTSCSTSKPVSSFPTVISGDSSRRKSECRSCRSARTGYVAKKAAAKS